MATTINVNGDVEDVPIEDLTPWPDNPRVGDVGALMESLEELGQLRPVLKLPDRTIIAGHHVVEAARRLDWATIKAVTISCDLDTAAKVVLADNRLADRGSYDAEALVTMLGDLDDLTGTGYDEADLEALASSLTEDQVFERVLYESADPVAIPPIDGAGPGTTTADDVGDSPGDNSPGDNAPTVPGDPEPLVVSPSTPPSELTDFEPGDGKVVRLDPEVMFPSSAPWHIPELILDKIPNTLPTMTTWASAKVTPPVDGECYLYNYGVDSAAGLPWERSVVACYTKDRYFEGWWDSPDYYVSRLLEAGPIAVVSPNFSLWEWPDAVSLFNIYRSRWVGRFMQEAGLMVVPDIMWPTGNAKLKELALAGVPHGAPWVSIQLQAVTAENVDQDMVSAEVVEVLNTIKPLSCLVYGGHSAHDVVKNIQGDTKTNLRWQPSRYLARHRKLYNRDPDGTT